MTRERTIRGQGRGRRRRRDDLLQARPGARARVRARAPGHPRAPARTRASIPREIDGFASYSNDRNDPSRLAAALGLPELRFSNMQWGGGGGGGSAAVGNAAAAVAAGYADCVVVFRALAQGQFGASAQRRPAARSPARPRCTFPYGLISPAQTLRDAGRCASCTTTASGRRRCARSRWRRTITRSPTRARSCTAGRSRAEAYDASRWIVEPFRLFDCCMENDGAAALVLVVGRARARPAPAARLPPRRGAGLRAPQRGPRRTTRPIYATSSFTTVAPHLWEMAGLGPKDVDVVQSYENFTGGVLMSLVEHGFFAPEEANEFLTVGEPLAPDGPAAAQHQRRQPRRVLHARARAADRGGAPAPRRVDQPGARGADVALVISGPMVTPVSSMLLGTEATLMSVTTYLPAGLPRPVPEPDGLDAPYWEGTRAGELACSAAAPAAAASGGRSGSAIAASPSTSTGSAVTPRGRIYSLGARLASGAPGAARITARTSSCWSSCPTPATCA